MGRQEENQGFVCERCGRCVEPITNGSYRNHCPFCLFSKHVDRVPGDRRSDCGGLMQPVGTVRKSGTGLQIVHRCLVCGAVRRNKAAEFTRQPDDIEVIIWLM